MCYLFPTTRSVSGSGPSEQEITGAEGGVGGRIGLVSARRQEGITDAVGLRTKSRDSRVLFYCVQKEEDIRITREECIAPLPLPLYPILSAYRFCVL